MIRLGNIIASTVATLWLACHATSTSLQKSALEEISSSEIATFNLIESDSTSDALAEEKDVISDSETVSHHSGDVQRSGVTNSYRLWEHLRYYLEGEFSYEEKRLIHIAFAILRHVLPCVTFERINSTLSGNEPHIVIQRGTGCTSAIGKVGIKQDIFLNDACLGALKPILHHLLHSLGLEHEHNRPDRDNYVTINWENIKTVSEPNFQKVDASDFSTYGIAYNPRSIMHYDLHAASANGKPTITLKENVLFAPDIPMTFGNIINTGLQATDINILRKMYSCGYS